MRILSVIKFSQKIHILYVSKHLDMSTLMKLFKSLTKKKNITLIQSQVLLWIFLDDPFKPEDIIIIQDPKNDKSKQVAEFDYLKNNVPFVPPEKLEPNIKEN